MKVFPFPDALKFRKSQPFLLEGLQASPFCPVNCSCELECTALFCSNARFFSEFLVSLVIIFLPVFILIFVLTKGQTSEAWEPSNNSNNKWSFGNWTALIIGNVIIIWFLRFHSGTSGRSMGFLLSKVTLFQKLGSIKKENVIFSCKRLVWNSEFLLGEAVNSVVTSKYPHP